MAAESSNDPCLDLLLNKMVSVSEIVDRTDKYVS